MHVLAIDAGSYSIKYVSSFLDRKNVTHVEMREHNLQAAMEENTNWASVEEATFKLLERIIQEVARPETKIVLHVPPEMVTTRFLTLPVKSRKKAEQMIPFQLEEDIPYSLTESHMAWRLETGKTQSLAMVALTRDSEFQALYDRLVTLKPAPTYVTSEASVMDAYFTQNPLPGTFCIMDMGHRSSKAYFFFNGHLIATHVSYIGGRHVDDMVAQTYGVSPHEAVIYKHQNAFVLTSLQTTEVDDNQREFARLMDQVFQPLVNDFTRWELGFRVTHGMRIEQVLICGGTASTKNMANYLTEKLGIKTALLESFEGVDVSKVDLNPKARAKFTLANMMSLSLRHKQGLINLLAGRYASASRAELPLHSIAFIASRATAVVVVLAFALLVENILLGLDLKAVNARLTTLTKNPILELNPRERRLVITDPSKIIANIGKKQRAIRQQISTLQAASDIKALSPLVAVASAAGVNDATLVDFSVTDGGETTAVFTSEDTAVLTGLQTRLQGVDLNNTSVTIDGNRLIFTGVQ
jgi:general secretion pathway protein L